MTHIHIYIYIYIICALSLAHIYIYMLQSCDLWSGGAGFEEKDTSALNFQSIHLPNMKTAWALLDVLKQRSVNWGSNQVTGIMCVYVSHLCVWNTKCNTKCITKCNIYIRIYIYTHILYYNSVFPEDSPVCLFDTHFCLLLSPHPNPNH
jgi:hypothetical protein